MRSITRTARFFLVQKLNLSNKEAIDLINKGHLKINNLPAQLNQAIVPTDIVEFNGQILQSPIKYIYLAYHKPRGIETTMNTNIPDNLANRLDNLGVFPIGRLDKDSEGLLLLTNDGSIYNKVQHSDSLQEKEYIVRVNQPITDLFLESMQNGITIMGQLTRPSKITQMDTFSFRIVLTQGLNRQIRRMCYKMGYEVTLLKRIRIINILLGNLEVGTWRDLTKEELMGLLDKIN